MAIQSDPVNLDMFDINDRKLDMETVEQREQIIAHYAKSPDTIFYISTSGGRDSQMQAIAIQKLVRKEQIVYVHANLGVMEHPGIVDHILRFKPEGIPLEIVEAKNDFVEITLLRGMFPSSRYRNCTSSLKVSKIDSFLRADLKRRGAQVGVNCVGLRSSESVPRSKRSPLFINKRLTKKDGSRLVLDYFPIFHLDNDEVYQGIVDAGQVPFYVYGIENVNGVATKVREGMSRTSCNFCILSRASDLKTAAHWYPDKYAMMIAIEQTISHTMFHKTLKKQPVKVSLSEKAGVPVDEVAVRRWQMILNERRNQLLEAKQVELEEKAEKKAERLKSKSRRFVDDRTIAMF